LALGELLEALMLENLEKELKRWRQTRATRKPARETAADRRTVKVNGQEVLVVKKTRKTPGSPSDPSVDSST
jgi:hypothetical protein